MAGAAGARLMTCAPASNSFLFFCFRFDVVGQLNFQNKRERIVNDTIWRQKWFAKVRNPTRNYTCVFAFGFLVNQRIWVTACAKHVMSMSAFSKNSISLMRNYVQGKNRKGQVSKTVTPACVSDSSRSECLSIIGSTYFVFTMMWVGKRNSGGVFPARWH